jgi:putative ABC transport system permease protein
MLQNYIKIALRNLLRNKVYSFINVLGLAIGISACLVIYLIVSFELSYENFQPEKDRIYRVITTFKSHDNGTTSYNCGLSAPMPKAIRSEFNGIEKLVAFYAFWTKVAVGKEATIKKFPMPQWGNSSPDIAICEPEYFDIFKYEWLYGNAKNALKNPNEVVLTDERVAKYFGNIPPATAIGKEIIYNDSLIVKVVGVVKCLPKNTDLVFQDFISFKTIEAKNWRDQFGLDQWTNTNGDSQAFMKLAHGTKPKNIEAQFPKFMAKHLSKEDNDGNRILKLQALSDIHFNADIQNTFGRSAHLPTLYILMGVAVFLLLIAAINFINLATAQSINRVKEIGIRKVLGSSRKSLIVQFMCETFIITLAAVMLSIIIIEPIMWAYSDYIPKDVVFDLFQPKIMYFLMGILLVTSFLSGLYPAFVISAYNPVMSLKNMVSSGKSRTTFIRKGLITFQFAFSQIFILGTILVATQSKYMLDKDMGFKKNAIFYFETNWNEPVEKKQVLVEKIRQMPEVELVSVAEVAARKGYSTTEVKYDNGKKIITIQPHRKNVDANFIPLYGIKILAGRNLTNSDTLKEYVVNESFLKAIGIKSPHEAIGKMISYYDTKRNPAKFPIVGVIADYHFQSLHNKIYPLFMAGETQYGKINIKIKTVNNNSTDVAKVLGKIKSEYNKVYPNNDEVFEAKFYDQTIANFYESERKMSQLLNTATGIAILISCLGLFGLVAFSTAQRTKEIGIRKVLGASVRQIVGLLSKDFLKLVIISIFIASPIAYYFMNKWLQDFAYRINIEWWIFALAGMVAIVIALLTVSYQAIKAALVNPVKSLRTE